MFLSLDSWSWTLYDSMIIVSDGKTVIMLARQAITVDILYFNTNYCLQILYYLIFTLASTGLTLVQLGQE